MGLEEYPLFRVLTGEVAASQGGSTQPDRLHHSIGAPSGVQLAHRVLEMGMHRVGAEAEDHADLVVGLADRHPLHHFALAGGERLVRATAAFFDDGELEGLVGEGADDVERLARPLRQVRLEFQGLNTSSRPEADGIGFVKPSRIPTRGPPR